MNPELLSFLEKTDSYPHAPEEVEHIQTHISHVFITPPYVYKLKKQVDFGFLDYSTLKKRRTFCQREVELNRRLCEGIYLGVVSIVKNDQNYSIEPEDLDTPSVVEYAVKMKELPEEYFLHRYIRDNRLEIEHLDRVAHKLTTFYTGQHHENNLAQWGKPDSIKKNTDENFDQTRGFIGKTIDQATYNAVRFFTNCYLRQNEDLFQQRIKEGRIVDGHGDLHLDHIHITPVQVRIYDCIEFNDRFRFGDLAVDLAFLAMDLDFSECHQEERYFVKKMAKKLHDPDLLKIIDFYKCYRAYVKGKVKSLQSTESEVLKEDREKAVGIAKRYFNLSLRYALIGSAPNVIICMGRVGTGKSTLAKHLAEKLTIDRFSSDVIRKSMAGLPLEDRTPTGQRAELYSAEMSQKTYDLLLSKAEMKIKNSQSVILDATFSSSSFRQKLVRNMETLGGHVIFIEAQAPDVIIKQRLQDREDQRGVISDARAEDFAMLNNQYEAPDEIGQKQLVIINTAGSVGDTIELMYSKLVELNAEKEILNGSS